MNFLHSNPAALSASLLIASLCTAASVATWSERRTASDEARPRWTWTPALAIAIGTGVWLADFVPMLASGTSAAGFNLRLILLSLLIAIVGAGGGLTTAIARREPGVRFGGGVLFGMSFAAVHYVSLVATMDERPAIFDPKFVVASLLIGASLGGGILDLFRSTNGKRRFVVAGLFLLLGGLGLHFTAEAALGLEPVFANAVLLSPSMIAVSLAGAVCLISLAVVAAIKLTIRNHDKALDDLREAVDAIPVGVALFNAQDRCTLWNTHFTQHTASWGGEMSPGITYLGLIKQSPAAKAAGGAAWLEARLARHRNPGEPVEVAQGDRWFRLYERRIAKGGVISVSVDLTDLKRQAQSLSKALTAAEAANLAKGRFLTNISHELRTPLNGVLSIAKMLARTRLDGQQREMLSLIDGSGAKLRDLLADLIEASAPENGPPVLEVVRLDDLAASAAAKAASEAAAKQIGFTVDVASDARGAVQVDPKALRRAIRILLDNAVKFTQRGEVSLRIARAQDRPDQVVVEVRDTGCGFDPAHLERLFASFEQADDSLTRAHGGMGLGLGICRRIVEAMGGEIAAEGRPGQGASFWILLELPAMEEAVTSPVADQLHLLYAEDHPVNRKVMQYIMEAAGLELTCVDDGLQAVQAVASRPYDLVLMDMQMPVLDGLSAIRRIRAEETQAGSRRTPIIAVSAHAMSDHTAQSLAAGADLHLTKPIDAQKLLEAVARLTGDTSPRSLAA